MGLECVPVRYGIFQTDWNRDKVMCWILNSIAPFRILLDRKTSSAFPITKLVSVCGASLDPVS